MAAPQVQLDSTRTSALRRVPINLIRVRKQHNFRQEFEPAALQDLADSIKQKGILQPLVLRYVDARKGATVDIAYELVAGERRLRAAKIAGLKEVPAIVRELSDAEADEIMVVENLQRQDLNDLEYAEGFNRLIKTHGYTVEQLAKKVDKGPTFVRDLLHLVQLPQCARDGLLQGRIPKSVGVLISTIPDEGQREKFAKEVLRGNTHGSYDRGHALSFREAKEWKEKTYMKVLSGAPFPLDKPIDPAWPHSCKTCPHFAGNQNGTSQQGKRSDICLNPPHYQHLAKLFGEQKIERLQSDGQQVVAKAQAKKMFYEGGDGKYYHSTHGDQKYVALSDSFTDYAKNHQRFNWAAVVKKAGLELVLAVTPDGATHQLALRKEAEAAAKSQGHKLSYSSSNSSISTRRPSMSEEKRKAVGASREVAVLAVLRKSLDTKWNRAPLSLWRLIAASTIEMVRMGDGGEEVVAKLLGAEKPKKTGRGSFDHYAKFLQKRIESARTIESLEQILMALLIADRLTNCMGEYASEFTKDDVKLCTNLGVDVKKIERTELARLEAESKAKKTPVKQAKKTKGR